jgi:hypothetical protein
VRHKEKRRALPKTQKGNKMNYYTIENLIISLTDEEEAILREYQTILREKSNLEYPFMQLLRNEILTGLQDRIKEAQWYNKTQKRKGE